MRREARFLESALAKNVPHRRDTNAFRGQAARLATSVGPPEAARRPGVPRAALGNRLRSREATPGVAASVSRARPSVSVERRIGAGGGTQAALQGVSECEARWEKPLKRVGLRRERGAVKSAGSDAYRDLARVSRRCRVDGGSRSDDCHGGSAQRAKGRRGLRCGTHAVVRLTAGHDCHRLRTAAYR